MRHISILSKLLKEFAEKPDDAAVIDSSFATLFNPTSSFAGETARNKATRADALQGRSGESAPPSRGSSSHSRRSGRVGTSRNPNAMLKLDSKDMNGDTAIHIAARYFRHFVSVASSRSTLILSFLSYLEWVWIK
jgi:hypothetical protein